MHTHTIRRAAREIAAAMLAVLLVACGGLSGGDGPQVPTLLAQPADQSVVEGSAATFSVAAGGAAPLAYQWSGSPDGITFTAIAGATNPSYSTGAALQGQTVTHYRVVVSNSLGSVNSSAVRLTVTANVGAPAITVQPADQSITAPAPATFNVTATGTSPAYEWQVSTDAGVTFNPVAGAADAPSLAVTGTTSAQSGQRYRVRVSNSAGSVTSSTALLTVSPTPVAPMFTRQPGSQSITAGQAVDFTVAATGTPAPTIQWRSNGNNLVNGAQASGVCAGASVAGATGATLTLTAVPIGCSGAVFSAVASNGVNPDATSSGATLTVNPASMAPSTTMQPADLSVQAPATATFTAAANGVPSPTVQWQQSTDAGVTWANINGATSPSYTTPATVVADNGKRFRAVFTNASGSANSNAAVLTVTATQANGLSLLAGSIGGPGNFDGAGGAAGFGYPRGVAVDATGNVYVADTNNSTIRKITPAGVVSTLAGSAGSCGSTDGTANAARFCYPEGLAVDAAGNVYVTDSGNYTIRKITPVGVVSTLAGSPGGQGSNDGTGSAAQFNLPLGVAVDAAGNVYVADTYNSTIRKITPAGVVSTLAGSAGSQGTADGTGSTARFNYPFGIAVDAAGSVYVADSANSTIRKITPLGVVSTLAGLASDFGSADGTGRAARFNNPNGVAADIAGNVFVADTGNSTIRKIAPAGAVTTLAGLAGTTGSMDGTGSAAQFSYPTGVAVDAIGNVHVADSIGTIRKITPAGVVSTLAGLAGSYGSADGTGSAAQFASPQGVAVDATGNVYVADNGNNAIRKITPAGVVSTLAGIAGAGGSTDGPGSTAQFSAPFGVAVDVTGNVYVADLNNHAIRKITPAGVVSTLAGLAGIPGSADGAGSAARFNEPFGVAVDATGNVYVADSGNHTIRKITPAGTVSTVVGAAGEAGIRLGVSGRLSYPKGVAVIGTNRLAITSANAVLVADLP